jgi:hypothetical protein
VIKFSFFIYRTKRNDKSIDFCYKCFCGGQYEPTSFYLTIFGEFVMLQERELEERLEQLHEKFEQLGRCL